MNAVESRQATQVVREFPSRSISSAAACGSKGGHARPPARAVRWSGRRLLAAVDRPGAPVSRTPPRVTAALTVPRSPRILRLTRRGRLAAVLLVAAAVYGAFGLGRASAVSFDSTSPPQAVVVQPGESLWTIAQHALPGQDPRHSVAQLKSLNHLTTFELSVGERIRVR